MDVPGTVAEAAEAPRASAAAAASERDEMLLRVMDMGL
jgi:hypothetical protein